LRSFPDNRIDAAVAIMRQFLATLLDRYQLQVYLLVLWKA
jgi:hypothetical protein